MTTTTPTTPTTPTAQSMKKSSSSQDLNKPSKQQQQQQRHHFQQRPGSVRRHRKSKKVVNPDRGVEDPALAEVFAEFSAERVDRDNKKYKTAVARLVNRFTKPKNNGVDSNMDSFFIVDLSSVARQTLKWNENLPNVRAFYAVKCNPNIGVLRVLDAMDCGFDCASMEEIEVVTKLLRDEKLKDLKKAGIAVLTNEEYEDKMNKNKIPPGEENNNIVVPAAAPAVTTAPVAAPVTPPAAPQQYMSRDTFERELKDEIALRIIYANPCKQVTHIRYARERGVKMTTLDNTAELEKLKIHWPDCHGVIRIRTDDKNSEFGFSSKFGCTKRESRELIRTAKRLDLLLVGVSFHVGSGCKDSNQYVTALKDARQVFDWAKEIGGYDFRLIDIGGGWPGSRVADPSFETMCATVRPVLYELFPPERYQLIGEPGRFIVTKSHTLVMNIYAKRDCRDGEEEEPRDFSGYDSVQEEDAVERAHLSKTMDDFLYYINDGVYQALNNIVWDHYSPIIKTLKKPSEKTFKYKSTLWGQTCDSMDLICKSYMLPELQVGDWIFCTEMGAYTSASSSRFNGFGGERIQYMWRN